MVGLLNFAKVHNVEVIVRFDDIWNTYTITLRKDIHNSMRVLTAEDIAHFSTDPTFYGNLILTDVLHELEKQIARYEGVWLQR